MLQHTLLTHTHNVTAASTGLFIPLVPRARNSECQNLLFPSRIKPLIVNLILIGGFLFLAPSIGADTRDNHANGLESHGVFI